GGDPLIISFSKVTRNDGNLVGGKNASLGELLKSLAPKGIRVPDGFAITSNAYRAFIRENELETLINDQIDRFYEDPDWLQEVGLAIRKEILAADLSEELKSEIRNAYERMTGDDSHPVSVAVRSSATAEDLPEASFAGQLETFLNVTGAEALLDACRKCFASLFTDRAISYRRHKGFTDKDIAISVGVQRMVRSDKACSGVMFSIDTETGFPNVILINSAWGLGETVVQGIVDPDEFEIFKPLLLNESVRPIFSKRCGAKAEKLIYSDREDTPTKLIATSMSDRTKLTLTDTEILTLARWAALIEDHYGQPMDMEWAKDGETGDLFVVQARPETVESRKTGGMLRRYRLKGEGEKLTHGLAVGDAIASAVVNRIDSAEKIKDFKEGSILVTRSTDPDWAPVMKKAAAIVTDHGGRTSHAAIVSRELGLPAVIGAENATEVLSDGQTVTVSCAEGSTGVVYDGAIEFEVEEVDLSSIPNTRTEVMLNLAQPSGAFRWWRFPADGVGLVRIEFIISNLIKVHPMALLNFGEVKDKSARAEIDSLTTGYANKSDFFVDRLAQGVAGGGAEARGNNGEVVI
ncbi:MAG: phosphoenolpyruvate synthase, partial [Pseudomonadota bacterium]